MKYETIKGVLILNISCVIEFIIGTSHVKLDDLWYNPEARKRVPSSSIYRELYVRGVDTYQTLRPRIVTFK